MQFKLLILLVCVSAVLSYSLGNEGESDEEEDGTKTNAPEYDTTTNATGIITTTKNPGGAGGLLSSKLLIFTVAFVGVWFKNNLHF